MLNERDIDFLANVLDRGTYTGIKSCLQVGEVAAKLQRMRLALDEQAKADPGSGTPEAVVSE